MANKFFNALASAFVVTNDESNSKQEVSKETKVESKVFTQTAPIVNVPTVQTVVNTNTAVNSQLLDKLCEKLESENLPGPDYMELKTAVNDGDMVNIIPDEKARFLVAFKSLKANAPSFSKKSVIDSIDKYVSLLKQWENEAITDINNRRNEVSGKKQQIADINRQIEELVSKANAIQSEVDITEEKCNQNENDMKTAVSLLVNKFNEDREKINSVLTD